MPAHQHTPTRALAMVLVLALLLVLVLPCSAADTTAAPVPDITMLSQTLDDVTLDVTDPGAASVLTVLIQRCTVAGGGLSVSCASTADAAGWTPIKLNVLDTSVTDATLTFHGYAPSNSLLRVVNMTATMKGSTPLFDLQGFYLKAGTGSSMTMQRVRATWTSAPGGSVVQLGGAENFEILSGQRFYFSDAVVAGAAHVLELTECTGAYCLYANDGLVAFDMITLNAARGAFLYSNVGGHTLLSAFSGMVRFSNITMTGGKPFFEAQNAETEVVHNFNQGNVVFSAISSDGALFNFDTSKSLCATYATVKYTIRHISVPSITAAGSNSQSVPLACDADAYSTWNWYMGNITVAGTLVNTLQDLDANHLYATQVTDAYGRVIEVRGDGWPEPKTRSASTANCVTGRDGNVSFVELVPGVNRAECNCDKAYYPPYCTSAVDPLVYYDGYSPSPAKCAVANCDACVFGQTSQCGACAFGYMLTASLECDKIPCHVANCSLCGTESVCGACAESYVLTSTNACALCAVSHCTQCASPGDGTKCATCADGYKLNDKSECKKTGTPWWVWLIVGIVVAAVVAAVIVVVVCCLRRRRPKAEETSSSKRATSNTAARRDSSDATEMGPYGFPLTAGAPPSSRPASRGAYQWNWDDCDAERTTQGSQTAVANPFDYDYQCE